MRVEVAVLTWNMLATGRDGFYRDCLASIRAASLEPIVVTNGSTDGTDKVVAGEPRGVVCNDNPKMYFGWELALRLAAASEPDLIVFSAEDIVYHDGWLDRLTAFWSEAPPEVAVTCQFLEPDYPWNSISGAIDAGGVRGLIRESAPSASWAFRLADFESLILPIPQQSPGEDHAICTRIKDADRWLVHLDVATHAGEAHSAWGNASHLTARKLDREKWGI